VSEKALHLPAFNALMNCPPQKLKENGLTKSYDQKNKSVNRTLGILP